LAHLDVKPVGVERDFAGDGDTAFVRAQIVVAVGKVESGGERAQLAPRMVKNCRRCARR
jgi:ketosteroid isomerase-like protein